MTRNEPEEFGSGDIYYCDEGYAYDDTPSMFIFFSQNPQCSLRSLGERIQWDSFIFIYLAYLGCLQIRSPPFNSL